MSRWAHITGAVRYDCSYGKDEEIIKTLGKIYRWSDDFEYDSPEYNAYCKEWEAAFDLRTNHIPMGSEGSLEYKILHEGIEPDEDGWVSEMADTEVLIWGDLRDVTDKSINYIKKWFKRIVSNKKLMVRQAVLQIDDEWSKSFIVLTHHDEWNEQKKEFVHFISETIIPKCGN